MHPPHIQNAIELIRLEYLEWPELSLTFWQARRLWLLAEDTCERALLELVWAGFLACTPDGLYVRATTGVAGTRRAQSRLQRVG